MVSFVQISTDQMVSCTLQAEPVLTVHMLCTEQSKTR